MTKSSLVIKDVSVAYAGKIAIDKIAMEVRAGETFGLMGLNGAGKTTLIKCILGLRKQDSGDILINNVPITHKKSREKIAFLPEKFEPPWFLTGIEFLRFSLDLYKQTYTNETLVAKAEQLGLDSYALQKRVHTYSKGMRQKLGLLATVLTNCPVIILDEPMSGLDPLARSLVKKIINDIKGGERTIFLSSHILSDMDELCDRVSILHNGKIRYIGSPKNLKNETSTENLESAFLEFVEKSKVA